MRTVGKTKFKTFLFSFNIQKNGGKLPVIVDVETDKLPEDLVKISKKPNLEAIAKQLNDTLTQIFPGLPISANVVRAL